MRNVFTGLLAVTMLVGLNACEKKEMVIVLPEVTATEAELAELAPEHRALVGTTWEVGDFQARFLNADTVFIAGEPLASIAPLGMEAPYTLVEGVIEVKAAGETKAGTWDGEKLVVDGSVAIKKQEQPNHLD